MKQKRRSGNDMFCPGCGNKVSEEANFCSYCGYKLNKPEKKYCTRCGSLIEPGSKFCLSCGADLSRQGSSGWDFYDVLYGCPSAKQIRGVVPDCMLKQGGELVEKEYK